MQSYAKDKNKTILKHKERKTYVNQEKVFKKYTNMKQKEFVTEISRQEKNRNTYPSNHVLPWTKSTILHLGWDTHRLAHQPYLQKPSISGVELRQ